jgi:hypothetical protein
MSNAEIIQLVLTSGIGLGVVITLIRLGRVLERQDNHGLRLDDHEERLREVEHLHR